MPYMYVNLRTGKTSGARSNPAEIGTLILEFGTLGEADATSRSTSTKRRTRSCSCTSAARRSVWSARRSTSRPASGSSTASHVGGGIDSYYEYLLKCARLFGDKDCAADVETSIRALNKHLADEAPSGFWYGQVDMDSGKRTATEFGALHAFLPAVLALGGDVNRARRLEESCFRMWKLRRHRARGARLPRR